MSLNGRTTTPPYAIVGAIALVAAGGRGSAEAEVAFWVALVVTLAFILHVYTPRAGDGGGCSFWVGVALAAFARVRLGRSGLGPFESALPPVLAATPCALALLVGAIADGVAQRRTSDARSRAKQAASLEELVPSLEDPRPGVFEAAATRFGELARPASVESVRFLERLCSANLPSWVKDATRAEALVRELLRDGASLEVRFEIFEGLRGWILDAEELVVAPLAARDDVDVARLAAAAFVLPRVLPRFRTHIDAVVRRVVAFDRERGLALARQAFIRGELRPATAAALGEEWAASLAAEAVALGGAGRIPAEDETIELLALLPPPSSLPLLVRVLASWKGEERRLLSLTLESKLFTGYGDVSLKKPGPLLLRAATESSEADRATLVAALNARLSETTWEYHRKVLLAIRDALRGPGTA